VVLADDDTITLKDLPVEIHSTSSAVAVETRSPVSDAWNRERGRQENEGSHVARKTLTFGQKHRRSEREQMVAALEEAGGNKAEAARRLEMPRSTFYSKLKKYGIAD
ncbi:MAG: hypothetical protein KDA81_15815, partial [Planctomycetaceae bacterium]|nr:hypothetical protein [Planctomycetaceae bacterium]